MGYFCGFRFLLFLPFILLKTVKVTVKLLSIVNVADLSRETAVEGGRIYAELVKKGEEIELNDCLIAATSLSLRIHEIVTRDIDHFNRIENIRATTPEELGF